MQISVIIPTLNEADHIGRLLTFLKNHQRADQFEVIVVDGGSQDETVEIINQYDVHCIQTNRSSRAHQMNIGARAALGDILYFVHADVELVPSFFADITGAISEGSSSGCFSCRFVGPTHPLLVINGLFTRLPYSWCRGGDQTLFVAKTQFEELGGYDESFVIMEDYDLIDKLRALGTFLIIKKNVKVSARKYASNSYLKVQFANLRAMRMYKRGDSSAKIKAYYSKAIAS